VCVWLRRLVVCWAEDGAVVQSHCRELWSCDQKRREEIKKSNVFDPPRCPCAGASWFGPVAVQPRTRRRTSFSGASANLCYGVKHINTFTRLVPGNKCSDFVLSQSCQVYDNCKTQKSSRSSHYGETKLRRFYF